MYNPNMPFVVIIIAVFKFIFIIAIIIVILIVIVVITKAKYSLTKWFRHSNLKSNKSFLPTSYLGAVNKRRRVGGGGKGSEISTNFDKEEGEGAEKFDVENIFINYSHLYGHFVVFLGSCHKSAHKCCSAHCNFPRYIHIYVHS